MLEEHGFHVGLRGLMMKTRLLMLFTLLLISILPSFAQDTTAHKVTFNNVSFVYPDAFAQNISITTYAGDPLDQPAPTMAGLEPPYVRFELSNEGNYRPELSMEVIKSADLVGYPEETTLTTLQTLLTQHPDLTLLESDLTSGAPSSLPARPLRGAAQILIARAQYIETDAFVGIRYLTVYAQDMYPINTDSFRYIFLGISKDGSTYVAMETFVRTDLFPDPSTITSDDLDAFYPDPHANYQQGIATVDAAPANAFTPNLDDLDALIATIQVMPNQ
jgi:hypothetical protein